MPEYQGFVSIDFWTALFGLVNMLITFAILKKFLFKPVLKMIDDRQKEIDSTYEDANKAKAEAEAMRESYSAKLADANAQGDEILRQATRNAQMRQEEILRDAQAQRTMERAQEQIELEKKQAMNDLKGQVSNIAVDIASAVLEEDVDGSKHTRLIDSFIDKLGE